MFDASLDGGRTSEKWSLGMGGHGWAWMGMDGHGWANTDLKSATEK